MTFRDDLKSVLTACGAGGTMADVILEGLYLIEHRRLQERRWDPRVWNAAFNATCRAVKSEQLNRGELETITFRILEAIIDASPDVTGLCVDPEVGADHDLLES